MDRFCERCGAKLDTGAEFCGECGAPVMQVNPQFNNQTDRQNMQQHNVQQSPGQNKNLVPIIAAIAGVLAVAVIVLVIMLAGKGKNDTKKADEGGFADNVTAKEQSEQENPAEDSKDKERTSVAGDEVTSTDGLIDGAEAGGLENASSKNPNIEELEPLPTAIVSELPDGYTVTTFGGLSLPHHSDFDVSKRDNMMTIEVPITEDTCETVTIVHEDDTNGVYRLSDKDDIIENAKIILEGDIYESEGQGDGYIIYCISGQAFGPNEEKEYSETDYFIFMEHELYTLSFLTDGADNRLMYTQWEMAFDPAVKWELGN